MKSIGAAIIVFAGVYLLNGTFESRSIIEQYEVMGVAIGFALMAIGFWLMFVSWMETKGTEHPIWLRFTVRDLFWLTLLAAITVAWVLDHLSLVEKLTNLHVAPPAPPT